MNAKARALAREFAGLPAEPAPATTIDETDPIKAIAAVLDQLPDDAARVAYLERRAVDAVKRNATEAKAIINWLNRTKANLTTAPVTDGTRPIVTDAKGRTLVLDGSKRGDLGATRATKSEIVARVAKLTDDQAIELYETTGRELNGAGPDRDPLTAGWCFEQADRLKAALKKQRR